MSTSVKAQSDVSLRSVKFDYGTVEPAVASFLKGQADRIRRQCSTSIIQIGKALQEAKRHLSHGVFVRWVEGEVGIPVRTAQAYMRAANWASGKSATVAYLSPSALYVLSATGVPDEFAADILSRTEAGEHIPPSKMRECLKSFRVAERRDRFQSKPSARQAAEVDDVLEVEAVDGDVHDSVAELAVILMRGLSVADFARVRDIVADDAVASDPQLARRLARVFERRDGRSRSIDDRSRPLLTHQGRSERPS